MIIIDEQKVKSACTYTKWVDAIENALRLVKDMDYTMPQRSHIDFGDNTLLLMPCISSEYYVCKLVSVFPGNREKDLPPVNGTVILNSAHTGEPLAILDGASLTAMRTAAVGSFGIRYLAPENVIGLGIVGLGTQGTFQCLAACSQRDFKKIIIYDSDKRNYSLFRNTVLKEYPDLEIIESANSTELCELSDVIITATNSLEPVLPDNEGLLTGRTIIGIGSYKPEMREFPDELFRLADKIFIDTEDGMKESGDLIYPLEKGLINIKQIYTGHDLVINTPDPGQTRVFKSVGMALFDLAGAILVYESLKNTNSQNPEK